MKNENTEDVIKSPFMKDTAVSGMYRCILSLFPSSSLDTRNGVTYLRYKQRADNKSCEGTGTLTAQSMDAFVYGEIVKKMRKFHTLKKSFLQEIGHLTNAQQAALIDFLKSFQS